MGYSGGIWGTVSQATTETRESWKWTIFGLLVFFPSFSFFSEFEWYPNLVVGEVLICSFYPFQLFLQPSASVSPSWQDPSVSSNLLVISFPTFVFSVFNINPLKTELMYYGLNVYVFYISLKRYKRFKQDNLRHPV